MTRLSDLLRGAADRAPIDEASVAVDRVSRRVRLNRSMRVAGNGVAGAGAAALVAFAVVIPGAAMTASSQDDLAPAAAPDAGGAVKANEADGMLAAPEGRAMAWGTCGSFPLQDFGYGAADGLGLAVAFDGSGTPDGGSTVDVAYTLTADDGVDAATSGPDVAVLWDGMVVATASGEDAETVLALAAGDSVDGSVALPLVDCFEGNPLPASKYELVVSQGFTNVQAETTSEPGAEPSVTPSDEPGVDPGPSTPEPPLPTDATLSRDSASDSAVEPDIAPMPVEPYGWDFRVTSEPVAFAIAGDPVDNPFADHFPQPWTPPEQPDDILTPEKARELFDAAVTSLPWGMAAGSSRWVMPNGAGGRETFAAEQEYFGCSWDGKPNPTFPSRSADLGFLTTRADVPDRVSVSYGWVVDDNPTISLTVTNTSDYSIPGFFGEPNRSLYLVKDGRVVAQAYPVNVDPNGGRLLAVDGVAVARAQEESDAYWGTLAPGESVSGTYLWRDVSTCANGDGTTARLSAGTYTLLAMQSISLQDYEAVYGGGIGIPVPEPLVDPAIAADAKASGGATESSGGIAPRGAIEPDIAIAPAQPDWLELQVWTSLGNVTIATH